MKEVTGQTRVVIEEIKPEIDDGRFPIKRVIGEKVVVEADIFADGHDVISALLLYRKENDREWAETPMELLINDHWRGSFVVTELGRYRYTVLAWVDQFRSWRRDLTKKFQADQEVSVELLVGAQLITEARQRAAKPERQKMSEWVSTLRSTQVAEHMKIKLALSQELSDLMDKYPDRRFAATYPEELAVVVDREKARSSAWYEMFPRSLMSRGAKALLRTARLTFLTLQPWVSMSSISHPSTLLDTRIVKGETIIL
jgi:starch synthase (maltosyl-transferring)